MVHMPRGWEAARLRSDHETKEKGASFRPQSQLVAVGRRKIRRNPPLENAAFHPASAAPMGSAFALKARGRSPAGPALQSHAGGQGFEPPGLHHRTKISCFPQ